MDVAKRQTPALVTDLYMGTDNPNATLGTVITGQPDSATDGGILYNFTEIDRVAAGFASALVQFLPVDPVPNLCVVGGLAFCI